MGRAKFQRRKGKSHNKIMPGASLKGHLMAKGFDAAAKPLPDHSKLMFVQARQPLKVQKKHCRLVNERTDIKSQNWANSIRIQKEKCLLLDLLPEVRLIIWEFCILNLRMQNPPSPVSPMMRAYT
ncbi:hypothetical protein BTUL_0183g00080 [Botrytis tulipae]|uniref:Uncharacterized protein n=1 Tax=Botrytis tulipae TaxID=87230 RepID=A0A4Z1EEN1_9HELO|nr:hypothetical protein BTUL_0183g00080 [Botrytis tulipae]